MLPRVSEMKKEKGFTLVELLVVVTVLVILATFLIPQVGAIRERARRSTCLENLRIIGIGLHTFAADNAGAFPTADAALTAFDSIYVAGNITDIGAFDCPSNAAVAAGALGAADPLTATDYIYNDTNLNDTSTATTVLAADLDNNHINNALWNVVRVSGAAAQVTADPLGADNT